MAENPSTKLRILVAEDDPATAQALSLFLSASGHDVQTVGDGRAALQAAKDASPDVVLMDLGLPGLSGHDLAREIAAQPARKIPLLVAITGRADDDDRRRSQEAGIDLHLVKPVDPEQLQQLLERFRAIVKPEPG